MGREGLANAAGEIVRGQITVRGRWSTDHRVPSGRPRKSRRKKVRPVRRVETHKRATEMQEIMCSSLVRLACHLSLARGDPRRCVL